MYTTELYTHTQMHSLMDVMSSPARIYRIKQSPATHMI